MGTNNATMTTTTENPPSWRNPQAIPNVPERYVAAPGSGADRGSDRGVDRSAPAAFPIPRPLQVVVKNQSGSVCFPFLKCLLSTQEPYEKGGLQLRQSIRVRFMGPTFTM